jgi:hypothetical protein
MKAAIPPRKSKVAVEVVVEGGGPGSFFSFKLAISGLASLLDEDMLIDKCEIN